MSMFWASRIPIRKTASLSGPQMTMVAVFGRVRKCVAGMISPILWWWRRVET